MQRKKRRLRTVEALRKYGRGVFGIFLVLFIISGIYMYGGFVTTQTSVTQNGVKPAAKVGDAEISYAQLQSRTQFNLERLRSMFLFSKLPPERRISTRIASLNELIEEEVLIQEAKKNRLNPTNAEIQNRIQTDMSAVMGPPPEKAKEISLKTLGQRILKGDERGREFRRRMRSVYGSYAAYLQSAKQELLRDKMDARIIDRAKEKARADVEQKANQALEKLKSGTPFEEVVKEFSEDPQTIKDQGGKMQAQTRDMLSESEAKELFTIPLNEPRLLKFPEEGYAAVVEVLQRNIADSPEFLAQKEKIRQSILEEKKRAGIENPDVTEEEITHRFETVHYRRIYFRLDWWSEKRKMMEELKASYSVEILDPWYRFDSLYNTWKLKEALEVWKEVKELYPESLDVEYFSCMLAERIYNRGVRGRLDPEEAEKKKSEQQKKEEVDRLRNEMKERCDAMIQLHDEGGIPDPYVLIQYARIAMMTARLDEAKNRLIQAYENAGMDGLLMMNLENQFEALGDKEWVEKVKKRREEIRMEQQEEARRLQVLR